MAMSFQLLDLLDQYESYEQRHGGSDDPRVQENITDMLYAVVEELQNLRPVLETPNFEHLLDFYAEEL
jgi:hypothetical protein